MKYTDIFEKVRKSVHGTHLAQIVIENSKKNVMA